MTNHSSIKDDAAILASLTNILKDNQPLTNSSENFNLAKSSLYLAQTSKNDQERILIFSTLKIIFRDKRTVEKFDSPEHEEDLKYLLNSLNFSEKSDLKLKVLESQLSAIHNLLFTFSKFVRFMLLEVAKSIVEFVVEKQSAVDKIDAISHTTSNYDIITFLCKRILIYITHSNIQPQMHCCNKHISKFLTCDSELLKIAFITLESDQVSILEKDDKLQEKILDFLVENIVESRNFDEHLLKSEILSVLFAVAPRSKSSESIKLENHPELLKILSNQLYNITPPNTTIFIIIASALCFYCKYNRKIRKLLTNLILPKRKYENVLTKRPEQENNLGAFLIKNFTEIHANDNVNKLSQKLIFVLCKENKDIFTNRVGYGNAAGFLLGLNNEVEEKGEYSSEDEDGLDGGVNEWVEEKSEKEIHTKNTKPTNKPDLENLSKYGQYDQVTGQFKLNIDPFKGMSDDEKEREARKLACLIQDLSKLGLMKPAQQNSDGSLDDLCLDGGVIQGAFREMAGLTGSGGNEEDESD